MARCRRPREPEVATATPRRFGLCSLCPPLRRSGTGRRSQSTAAAPASWKLIKAASTIVVAVRAGLPSRRCWGSHFHATNCCDIGKGLEGNVSCWGGGWDYSDCCVISALTWSPSETFGGGHEKDASGVFVSDDDTPSTSVLDGVVAAHEQSNKARWCGKMCTEPSEGKDRHWETLRYVMVSELVAHARSRSHRESLSLMEAELTIFFPWETHDLNVLKSLCLIGAAALELSRVGARPSHDNADPSPLALDATRALLESPHMWRNAFCSGWPVFRLMSLASENMSTTHTYDLWHRFFVLPSFAQAASDVDLRRALLACAAVAHLGACLRAGRPVLEGLHNLQRQHVFGEAICPPGSFAAWLDNMAPLPIVPLCVRGGNNVVDEEIRRRGSWFACHDLASLAKMAGPLGCQILDVGANIGACTVMLARLGHRVAAFEPLPRNAELLKASLNLNGISTANVEPVGGHANALQDAGNVSVTVHQYGLGERLGRGTLLEGRGNAGMTVIVPEWPYTSAYCEHRMFLCHQMRPVQVVRLDDEWDVRRGRICLAKIDVEGHEVRVLRGALNLLRAQMIEVIYLEWVPPHLRSLGEDPLTMLWLLHAVRYDIFAPARWFTGNQEDRSWLLVVPSQFDVLIRYWGDIIARASPAPDA
eukprot:TRINITY_DN75216_c0_g1_i1.p1 TRINITY_DN75216_c0_g1~~TRINITY_DN75216_c0_g1_i1.p1  ORF type:complete len:659 (-),score=86.15 TRINITY_DN75216_c0_g1_i1:110-2056(-)